MPLLCMYWQNMYTYWQKYRYDLSKARKLRVANIVSLGSRVQLWDNT